jgi:hypothetical protein
MNTSTIRILIAKLRGGYEEAVARRSFAFRAAGYEIVCVKNQRP